MCQHFFCDEYHTYLIFVIFFAQAEFLENKIYTEERQFLPIFRQFLPIYIEIYTQKRQFFALNL